VCEEIAAEQRVNHVYDSRVEEDGVGWLVGQFNKNLDVIVVTNGIRGVSIFFILILLSFARLCFWCTKTSNRLLCGQNSRKDT